MTARRPGRRAGRRQWRGFVVGALVCLQVLIGPATPSDAEPAEPASDAPGGTLVLFDTTGPYGFLGELYAIQAANLVSHFESWTALPVLEYEPGSLDAYGAVVYVGSTYDEPLPAAFLDDVWASPDEVLWLGANIWQLTARFPTFAARHGFVLTGYGSSDVAEVLYEGASLTRFAASGEPLMGTEVTDPALASVLATAVRPDGSTVPWAVGSERFTYLSEVPFSYANETDRYLAFADILFDVFAPETPPRHRALLRLEDIGPDADPDKLRAIADYLWAEGVPFSFGVFPVYTDPNGTYNNGVPETFELAQTPAVVDAIRYMTDRGGTMIMHGTTHQYGTAPNPYNGVSGDDFEFFTAHVNAENFVILDGPVPGDSTRWASGVIRTGRRALRAAGLPVPTIFEFPHYAGSAADYAAVGARFAARYERSLYFGGLLTGGAVDYSRLVGQFFPYAVTDVYGTRVIPENLGSYSPEPYNNHPPRLPADLVRAAEMNLVVRDGVASFFYHPYFGLDPLPEIVEGIRALGYVFVASGDFA